MNSVTDKDINIRVMLPTHWYSKPMYILVAPLTNGPYVAPKGFTSDGATIPRLLWWVWPPVNRYFLPAVMHDYTLSLNVGWHIANDNFYIDCEEAGVTKTTLIIFKIFVSTYAFFKVHFMGDVQ